MSPQGPDPRHPIGRFVRPTTFDPDALREWVDAIRTLPVALRDAVAGMDDAALDTPVREGGWTARQVVHHLADSHLHAFIRTKLALLGDWPTILPWSQDDWAAAADSGAEAPIGPSLAIVEGIHARWAILLDHALREGGADPLGGRGYFHPEQGRRVPLVEAVALYAWHGAHHVAQIRQVRRD